MLPKMTPPNERKNKVAFFDIGATLIDGPNLQPATRLREALDLAHISKEQVSKIIFETSFDSPEPLYRRLMEYSQSASGKGFDAFLDLWNNQIQEADEIPGATACVQKFKEAGFTIGLISNIWHPYYLAFKRTCTEILALVSPEAIFLSYEQEMRKPDHALFQRALQRLGVSASQAVMIGDTYHADIQPALELGMKAVWILRRPAKELDDIVRLLNGEAPSPDVTVKSIAELNPSSIV
jgi:HAD superfamily hydrolase (TIGR01509 family)